MPTSITAEEVKIKVENALNQLKENDIYLLRNDLNECSINHKFAYHLQHQFPEWDVDCEYNKDEDKVKELDLPKDKVDCGPWGTPLTNWTKRRVRV